MPNDMVNDQYGPPHRYGDTIWDMFRPDPRAQQELYQNLYGAGATGQEINAVTPSRSAFGRLLQGVGVLGKPDARAMTPYEQFMYQEGKHYKSTEDFQTEEQRQTGLARSLNLAQDYVNTEGQMPPSEFMKGLPAESQGGFEHQLSERNATQEYQGLKRGLDLQGEEASLAYRQKATDLLGTQKAGLDEQRHFQNLGQMSRLVTREAKDYEEVMKGAMSETDPIKKHALLEKARQLHLRMQAKLSGTGAPATDILSIIGEIPDSNMALQKQPTGEDTRMINTPETVGGFLNSRFGWPNSVTEK